MILLKDHLKCPIINGYDCINLSNKDDFNKLISFLNINNTYGLTNFFHKNKT